MKGRLHEENGQYCFIEVEIEESTEEAFIASYLRVLSKLRLAHSDMRENGLEGDIKASEKQIDLLKRLAKTADKELSSITEYVAKKFRKPTIQQLTKEEASDVISLLTPKKGEDDV
jgi:23S rRNA U2552 (ribose-2'-O)-methylase RlmE/FtsJ